MKLEEYLGKKFYVTNKMFITRMDYETMPCPMKAWDWSDEKMKALADAISKWDDLENEFWIAMENEAVQMGMVYYEDMNALDYEVDRRKFDKFSLTLNK